MNKEKAQHYIEELLDIIDNLDGFTKIQVGYLISGIVYKIAMDESLLDFEERLERSRASDLQ